MTDVERQLREWIESRVRERMAGQQSGHGIDHVLRVVRTAREIQAEIGGDPLVVELASWLHDIGDAKFHKGIERSAEFSRQLLGEYGASQETIEYGATLGQPFYLPSDNEYAAKTGVGHFHEKLFKIRDLLNTEPARRIAGQQEQFMRTFLKQYFQECGETEDIE